jgi:phenylacetate-CoA ligase
MGVQCRQGWLHYNADWYILEAVDAGYRPVPPGTRSQTVLVTNLTNRLMPFIRYDQGDSVLVKPGPCACGSAFPAIRVTGRTDDLLHLPSRSGECTIPVTPLSLITVIEETPGVYRVQVLHRAPADLEIRLQVLPGADTGAVWAAVTTRVHSHLQEQGAGPVTLHHSAEPPVQQPRSGKYAQVINLQQRAASA